MRNGTHAKDRFRHSSCDHGRGERRDATPKTARRQSAPTRPTPPGPFVNRNSKLAEPGLHQPGITLVRLRLVRHAGARRTPEGVMRTLSRPTRNASAVSQGAPKNARRRELLPSLTPCTASSGRPKCRRNSLATGTACAHPSCRSARRPVASTPGGQTTMRTTMRTWMVVGLLGAVVPAPLAAQTPPPVQGTIALEGTMTKFYRGINALVVTTIDGAEHVYHFAKGLVVHGAKASGPDAARGAAAGHARRRPLPDRRGRGVGRGNRSRRGRRLEGDRRRRRAARSPPPGDRAEIRRRQNRNAAPDRSGGQ